MGLIGAAVLVGGALWAGEQEKAFERRAAADLLAQMKGGRGEVRVNVRPNGIGGAWGDLAEATITASGFELDGLPLFTEPERSTSGRIGVLRLRLRDFVLGGLRVAELSADIPGCRFDFGLARGSRKIRLSRSGEGTGWVRIREEDLADYLVRKYAEIKRATVRVDRGVVWVEGYGEFLIVKSDFAVVAGLEAVDGTKLNLSRAKVFFDWQRSEPVAVEALLRTLNPVVDLREDLGLYDAVTVEEIVLRGGVLEVRGPTRIPERPRESVAPASRAGAESRGLLEGSGFFSTFADGE